MLNRFPVFLLAILLLFSSGCSWFYKGKVKTPALLKVENASREQLLNEINRYAKVNSMKAKMILQFEDNSSAQAGTKESYIGVDLDIRLQRPSNIFLKVGIFGADIAQMTSNGEKFRVALLKDRSGGKNKMFLTGTNNADYSKLQNELKENSNTDAKNASSFANMRPQHLTDALLIRPLESKNTYLQSTISLTEEDTQKRKVERGYYLLDEFIKDSNGELKISRRFWFDRVISIRLARQQLFDNKGEIESDIIYGQEGKLTATSEFNNLPLKIIVTRPKEKYTMSLTYQDPATVTIGDSFKADIFDLKNTWELREVNLDDSLLQVTGQRSAFNNQQ